MRENDYAHVPIMAMATSGGVYASAFTGAGALRALDDLEDFANDQRTGDLLQSLTYLFGLLEISWPTLSFTL